MSSECTVHHGDNREVLRGLPDCSVDSVVTDPPYALVSIVRRFGAEGSAAAKGDVYARASAGFMGQQWDTGETAFDPAFWAEVLRVLKPGGHLVAASGTRTYHRLACAVEDAGFEIRDMVSWLYGSGFPKSHDVSKGIDRAAGVEREAAPGRHGAADSVVAIAGANRECVTCGRQRGGQPGNCQCAKHSVAATPEAQEWEGWGTALKPACEPWVLARKPLIGTVAANVLAHGTGALNIDGCRVGDDVTTTVRNGNSGGNGAYGRDERVFRRENPPGRWPANVVHDGSDEVVGAFPQTGESSGRDSRGRVHQAFTDDARESTRDDVHPGFGDRGSAARFFYTAKAGTLDRFGSRHPTVKPVNLMRWLVRLVTPPGGVVLDPFAGSGTTGAACVAEGFSSVLIEREADYVADIRRRIAWTRGEGRLLSEETARRVPSPRERLDGDMF